MLLTTQMSLPELMAVSKLAPVKDQFVTKMDFSRFGDMSMDEIGAQEGWNVKSFVGGMNAILQQSTEAHWFERGYSAKEIAECPAKANVNLVYLESYVPGADDRPYALIVPGGGYFNVWNMSEGWPIAAHLNRLGYHAFVLNYRVGRDESKFPDQLEDYAAAMKLIRDNHYWYRVKWDNYFTTGFSAGGHLVVTWGMKQYGYAKYGMPKPKCIFPVYAPIAWPRVYEETAHYWEDPANAVDYPPCYIAHAEGDRLVDPENARTLKRVLDANGIPAALEIGPEGGHGFAEGTGMCMDGWIDRAVAFMEGLS